MIATSDLDVILATNAFLCFASSKRIFGSAFTIASAMAPPDMLPLVKTKARTPAAIKASFSTGR